MEAVQIIRNNAEALCLVILDTILPDESGLDTCKRLKEIRSDLKVLHKSGLGKTQGGEDLECGCDEFLPKPFRMKELSDSLVDLALNTKK